jgi:hypothetical protein
VKTYIGVADLICIAFHVTKYIRDFFNRHYGWMAAGLALTAFVSLTVSSSPALFNMLYANRMIFFGLIIAEFALVFAIAGFAVRMGTATAAPLILLYSALNGVTISGIFMVYTGNSISSAFFTAVGIFCAMSDRYGRTVCIVWLGKRNINLEMIVDGWAWAYIQYLDRPHASEYIQAEEQARAKRLGLWQQDNTQPPWEFRKLLRRHHK